MQAKKATYSAVIDSYPWRCCRFVFVQTFSRSGLKNDLRLAIADQMEGPGMTRDEINAIKEDIRSSYALPVRDFLEFTYRARFPEDTSARVAFVLGHYNYFLNAVTKSAAELAPHRDSLLRLCDRFAVPTDTVEEVNQSLVLELMKLTAVQRRNSPDVLAAYNLVVAMIAHALWGKS
jgi:hypothetical protein